MDEMGTRTVDEALRAGWLGPSLELLDLGGERRIARVTFASGLVAEVEVCFELPHPHARWRGGDRHAGFRCRWRGMPAAALGAGTRLPLDASAGSWRGEKGEETFEFAAGLLVAAWRAAEEEWQR